MNIDNALYEKLLNCNWFGNCGTRESIDFGFEVSLVTNEKEMKKNIISLKWENVCLEENGNLTSFLYQNHKNEYNKYWNSEIELIKKEYLPSILDKIIEKNKKRLLIEILDDVKMNIIFILMADFYSEFYKADFFITLLEIYLSGHLPCGWNGSYPEGKIMIY